MDEYFGWLDFELRSYDPQIGRFLQADPYGQFASGYVGMGNDPVNGVDPSGGFFSSTISAVTMVGCPGVSGLASIGYSAMSTISSLASSFFTVANIAVRTVNDGNINKGKGLFFQGAQNEVDVDLIKVTIYHSETELDNFKNDFDSKTGSYLFAAVTSLEKAVSQVEKKFGKSKKFTTIIISSHGTDEGAAWLENGYGLTGDMIKEYTDGEGVSKYSPEFREKIVNAVKTLNTLVQKVKKGGNLVIQKCSGGNLDGSDYFGSNVLDLNCGINVFTNSSNTVDTYEKNLKSSLLYQSGLNYIKHNGSWTQHRIDKKSQQKKKVRLNKKQLYPNYDGTFKVL
ncbi:RHS repeat-associated core domain-containing protein [Polluticaenibacter yanchengensis]|uniref:RHS repeat-associated core domain-containing protein n=1 Tax=Polluticaenibacter yanchengensis TaxID=3014562 RepID=A0ABT4UPS8_9BACT|nr:hypothetical protein [Chitinophagaceae bacterium LY-5]